MTPEHKLIEAVLATVAAGFPESVECALSDPSVQTALAEARGNIRNPDATDEDPMVRDVEAWLAANPPATPKPEPVLRWEGDDLFLGENKVATAFKSFGRKGYGWCCFLDGREIFYAPTLTEARTAAEQAVRDWLKRAGCV